MSRSRSRSPHYRRFPWEEPDFDPRTVVDQLDGNPQDRGHHPREGPEDFRDPYWEERYPEGPRRSPFRDDFHFRHQRHSDHEEFHRWAESPPRDAIPLEDRRFSQRDEGDSDADRHRTEFRDDFYRFDERREIPPTLLPRLRGSSNTQRVSADHHTRKAWEGRRSEEQDRDHGRPRDFSPGMRSDDQRAEEMLKEGRFPEYPNRGRQREGWDPAFKRPRREMDFVDHPGYREEKDFVDRGYSVHRPRGGFRDRTLGSLPREDSGPFVGEHDHSVERGRNQQQFENFEDRRNDPNFDRQRSPSSAGSSQEHFRKSTSRPRENSRGKHFQNDSRHGNYQEPRRSPNTMRYDQQGGPENYRGRGRELDDQGPRGRAEPNRNQPRYQDRTQGGQRPDHHPIRDDYEKIPNWIDEDKIQQWRQSRSRSLEQNSPRDDLHPKRPPQRNQAWSDRRPDNMTVITKETLTINVDMSRPLSNNSPLCYSTDRLLSMDLVNAGRTRQDFMPLLEHSGMYREKATHTGTFAQEIISLVHFVKEQYFRGDGLTLNKRFSAPQKGGYSQDDSEELTLNQRFSSSRGFSLNMDSIFDDGDDEFLFSKLGSMQGVSNHPKRDPSDLRHDLERRRQEKLEAVKVTIAGSSLSHHSQSSDSEPDLAPPVDHEGYSGRAGDQNRSREGSVERGFRKGAYNRPNMSPQRRKAPLGNEREKHSNPPGNFLFSLG
ncbi:PREDICTED: uncharacterized protein CXorf23-like [Cyprinodon variegatus]|uniref:BCLAF1 and THRAP3 family member 3 n=1 Tax=Cyprinodon variegatus TaxID=28743 RepID=A0A3Q2E9B4_CYPVA|nr:PREDICTED: uncharacterized protein CXorf23-like [Cyprinodon variegatus]